MGEKIKDPVFGEMEYDCGWTKKQEVHFLDKFSVVEIVVSAYTGESIVEEQHKSYKYFMENEEKINSELPKIIQDYIDENIEDIRLDYPEIDNIKKLSDIVRPSTLLFDTDGNFVFLCDVSWDEENGIGIEIFPDYKVDIQDMFI